MRRKAPRDRVIWPVPAWPARDREAWVRGCSNDDPFADDCPGATLRPATLVIYEKAIGGWLSFLALKGWLDESQEPIARVTRPRLRAYFRMLKASGNADFTIIAKFSGLARALSILCPDADTSWIRRPDGVSIYALLPKKRRPMQAPDSAVLFNAGLEVMRRASEQTPPRYQPMRYRDGLLLAMFAARARRLGSMTCPRIGQEIKRVGDVYRIELSEEQIKTGKQDHFDLPAILTPFIHTYLARSRPAMLRDQATTAFWINQYGQPLRDTAIYQQFRRLTKQLFRTGFGPHRCRHALATTCILRAPDDPGLPSGVLGISGAVVERHCRLAGQSASIANLAALNRSKRRASKRNPRN